MASRTPRSIHEEASGAARSNLRAAVPVLSAPIIARLSERARPQSIDRSLEMPRGKRTNHLVGGNSSRLKASFRLSRNDAVKWWAGARRRAAFRMRNAACRQAAALHQTVPECSFVNGTPTAWIRPRSSSPGFRLRPSAFPIRRSRNHGAEVPRSALGLAFREILRGSGSSHLQKVDPRTIQVRTQRIYRRKPARSSRVRD